jgi:non-ribosomal peptide synthetase component E (peptide arylation enzyme)
VAGAPLELEELRAFCKARLANFKLPERLLIVDELPLTDFGKVDRKILRSRFAEQAQ